MRLSHMQQDARQPSLSRAMMLNHSMSAPGGRVQSSTGRGPQQRALQQQQRQAQDEEEGEW
jgi:hypothetical protein